MAELFSKKAEMLNEAFPEVEKNIIRAVLSASKGNSEDAFHALIGLNDPEYQKEREQEIARRIVCENDQQALRDYQYAIWLQKTFQKQRSPVANVDSEEETSWFDEEMPKIKQQMQERFRETKERVGKFLDRVKYRIENGKSDEEREELYDNEELNRKKQLAYLQSRNEKAVRAHYKSQMSNSKGSGPLGYDLDPKSLDENFLNLHINENSPPKLPNRPKSDASLEKTKTSSQSKTSFESVSQGSRWQPIKPSKDLASSAFNIGEDSSEEDDEEKPSKHDNNMMEQEIHSLIKDNESLVQHNDNLKDTDNLAKK